MKYIEKIIEEIHNGPLYGEFIENGGPCVAAELMKYSGASNTIYHASVPYSKDFNISGHRSVSLENVAYVERLAQLGCNNEKINFRFVSSFQVGPDKVTHGYIALRKFGKLKFYHLTENDSQFRNTIIDKLNDDQIRLLNNNQTRYIDGIWNEDLSPNILETLQEIKNHFTNDYKSCYIKNGKIYRTEDFLRSSKNLVIYKGSFNPVHNGHLEIIKYFENEKDTSVCFSISTKNFDKEVDLKNLEKRIEWINKLGYGVLVFSDPLFEDMEYFLRRKIGDEQTITFPLGMDTFVRLCKGYENPKEEIERLDAKFVVFDRNNKMKNVNNKYINNVRFVDYDCSLSSSENRNGSINGIPDTIKNDVEDYFGKINSE